MERLDNVIWSALTTRLAGLGVRHGAAAKFDREVSILGGIAEPTVAAYDDLARLLEVGDEVGIFAAEAPSVPNLAVIRSVPLLQMARLHDDAPPAPEFAAGHQLVSLRAGDVPEMAALVEICKPGPFNRRTHEMGDFFGLRFDGQLVAMAGERMRVPGFTELSAICTHPAHLGRGHAAALMSVLIRRVHARGERACLHVLPENTRAIAVYERAGFTARLRSRYVVLRRT